MYGSGIMFVTVEDFSTWGFKVPETFLDRARKKSNAWVVPAGFCYMRTINDSCNLPGDRSTVV